MSASCSSPLVAPSSLVPALVLALDAATAAPHARTHGVYALATARFGIHRPHGDMDTSLAHCEGEARTAMHSVWGGSPSRSVRAPRSPGLLSRHCDARPRENMPGRAQSVRYPRASRCHAWRSRATRCRRICSRAMGCARVSCAQPVAKIKGTPVTCSARARPFAAAAAAPPPASSPAARRSPWHLSPPPRLSSPPAVSCP